MVDSSVLACFSADYGEAREKFLDACAARSLTVDSRLNPNAKGVRGEDLYADITLIGSPDAPKVLLLLSGTHGVEGYCGSGAQIALLREGFFADLPSDLCVIMVHAMNPYGFSHNRRVTEENVDLNRNFVDFASDDLPGADYARVHDYILPTDWDGPGREEADKGLLGFIENHGMPAFQAAITSGQHQFPDGVFYGGQAPTWSNEMLHGVMADYLAGKQVVAAIDFHTGLGPHGVGELIGIGSESQKARAARWYGDQVTDAEAGTSSSAPLTGMLAHGMAQALPKTELTFVTLEYGTYDVLTVLTALRGDNWLYQRGDVTTSLGTDIKREIRKAFYPDTDEWKSAVWDRAREVVDMALKGLGGG